MTAPTALGHSDAPGEPGAPRIRPGRVVGLASILLDRTVDIPALPPRGGDVVGSDAGEAAGGGINALGAASRLGLPAAYAGPHGTGPIGDAVRSALDSDRIAALLPPDPDGDTGYCLALLEPDGERTFVTVPGVEARQTAAGLAEVRLREADVLYVSGYDLGYPVSGPALGPWLAGLEPSRPGTGPWLALDPGPLVASIPPRRLAAALARTDMISTSAAELPALGGRDALLAALPDDAVVIVRDGARGCLLIAPDGFELAVAAAPPPGPVLDSNGAGDVHLGALLTGLADGLDWPAALERAGRAAAWSLTVRGANSAPHLSAIMHDPR
jgi:sugar/nucleoside kinase (ribokinase family)